MRVAVSSAAQKHEPGTFNTKVGLMLGKCRKQWPNIKLALCQPVGSFYFQ